MGTTGVLAVQRKLSKSAANELRDAGAEESIGCAVARGEVHSANGVHFRRLLWPIMASRHAATHYRIYSLFFTRIEDDMLYRIFQIPHFNDSTASHFRTI